MDSYSRTPRIQTGTILLLCFTALILTVVYRCSKNDGGLHNLTCRFMIEIVRNTGSLRGIIDIKTGGSKGIVSIDGVIRNAENSERAVQYMVLLTQPGYGPSPVWISQKIQISNRETALTSLIQDLLPSLFLANTNISNADFFALNSETYLITKEGIPYLYCQNYALSEDQ